MIRSFLVNKSKLTTAAYLTALICANPTRGSAQLQSPLNAQGEVGLTSYTKLPFASEVYQQSWGSSPYLAPGEVFWQNGTWFNNIDNVSQARGASKQLSEMHIVAASGMQRWEDTYEISLPVSMFLGEPSNMAADRNSGVASGPEFAAWANWVKAHPNLQILAADGGSWPTSWRAWSGSYGFISPLMPLAANDCPPDMKTCVYGDLYAYAWGQTAHLSGAYAVGLSDFADSQPGQSDEVGFNPEIIAGFKSFEHVAVPNGTISSESSWIIKNAINKWNDYLSTGYSRFFKSLVTRLGAATSTNALVIDQCGRWPALERAYGIDERIIAKYISTKNYICNWDAQTMQTGRSGQDPVFGVGSYAIAAAREPNIRNGANLESEDSNYWSAIASFYPSLSTADQQELGTKLLRRSWLEGSWAHIATRSGMVRRAMSLMSRDYWDLGTLDATLQNLISSVTPTRPFGFAIYYSVAAERAVEKAVAPNAADTYANSYYNPTELMNFKNEGVPVGYYISDAALPAMTTAAKPAAWVIIENSELIPAAEMSALTAIAPVLTSVRQVRAFSKAPLAFSVGLTGTGFYDQNDRLVITVSNPSSSNVSGFMKLQGIADGTYTVLDLFTHQSVIMTVSEGIGNLPLIVTRWDTRALAITPYK